MNGDVEYISQQKQEIHCRVDYRMGVNRAWASERLVYCRQSLAPRLVRAGLVTP